MTSMIDAVFLLLSYFLFTTGAALPEEQLSAVARTNRPAASALSPQVIDVVEEAGEPVFLLGARRINGREQLTELLQQLPKSGGVVVRVHSGPAVSAAAAALQAAHDAGFSEVSYVPAP
ncbi:MAG: hypothetical protein EXS00_02750 [Phycisphaerales bacterium]|nr:hypothetical protein [Phycisphaerales bacterium]